MKNRETEFEISLLGGGDFNFRICLQGSCKFEDLKIIQNLFNNYLEWIETKSLLEIKE